MMETNDNSVSNLENLITPKITTKLEELEREYGKEKVELALESLSTSDRELLEQFYGINGASKLNASELANKYNVPKYKIYNLMYYSIFPKIISKLNGVEKQEKKFSKIKELYQKYSEEQIKEALLALDEEDRKLLEQYYGINGAKKIPTFDLASEYGVARYTISNKIHYTIYPKLIKILEGISVHPSNANKVSKYNELISLYTQEDICKALDKIDSKDAKIFKLYYGIEGNDRLQAAELAKLYGYETRYIYTIVNRVYRNIVKFYSKEDYTNRGFYNLKKLYSDYSEENLLEVLSRLNNHEYSLLQQYYGLNGVEKKSAQELANIYQVSSKDIYHSIRRVRRKMEKLLSAKKSNFTIVSEFDKLCSKYGKEKILAIVELLDDKDRELIKAYYQKQEQIDNIEDIKNAIKKIEQRLKGEKTHLTRREKLLKAFGTYDEKRVLEFIKYYKEFNKKVIISYYGFCGNKQKSVQEIALELNCNPSKINTIINIKKTYGSKINLDDYEQVREYLKTDSLTQQEIEERFDDKLYGVIMSLSKQDLESVMHSLSKKNRYLIKLYYGIDYDKFVSIEGIKSLIGINEDELHLTITRIRSQVVKERKNASITNIERLYQDIFFWNNKSEKDIALSHLTDNELTLFNDYFGLNKSNMTLKEISIKYNISREQISKAITTITTKIKLILNEFENINVRKKELLSILNNNELELMEAVRGLSNNEKNLFYFYYGLNGNRQVSIKELSEKLKIKESSIEIMINKILLKISTEIKPKTIIIDKRRIK